MSLYAFGIYNQKTQFKVTSAIKKFNGLSKRKFKNRVGFQLDDFHMDSKKAQLVPHRRPTFPLPLHSTIHMVSFNLRFVSLLILTWWPVVV